MVTIGSLRRTPASYMISHAISLNFLSSLRLILSVSSLGETVLIGRYIGDFEKSSHMKSRKFFTLSRLLSYGNAAAILLNNTICFRMGIDRK